MRRETGILLFCLLTSAMAITAVKTVIPNKCINKNKFIEALSKGDPLTVEVFDVPLMPGKKPFEKCASEWNQFGTCCNVVHLEALHSFEQGTIDHNRHYLETALTDLASIISQQPSVSASFKKKVVEAVEGFNSSSNKCWGHMANIRGAALCPTCSGRSESFFNAAKDKLLIGADTCRDVVDKCEPVFKTLSWLKKQIGNIENEFKKVTDKAAQQAVTTYLAEIKRYSPPKELEDAFAVYDLQKQDEVRTGVYSASLCAMFVNIRKKPFIWVDDANSRHRKKKAEIKIKYDEVAALESTFENSIDLKTLTPADTSNARAKFFGAAYAKYQAMEAELQAAKDTYNKEREIERSNKNSLSLLTAGSRSLMNELALAHSPFADLVADCSVLLDSSDVAGFSKNDLADCCTVQSLSMGAQNFRAMNLSLAFP
jgi:hypothetical protein